MEKDLGGEFVPSFTREMSAEIEPVVAFAVIGDEAVEGFGLEGGEEELAEGISVAGRLHGGMIAGRGAADIIRECERLLLLR